jgi:hypothetical protein
MIGLLLTLSMAQNSSESMSDQDIRALMETRIHDVTMPLRTCFRETSDRFAVPPDQAGDEQAASRFMNRTLAGCGLQPAMERVTAALRHHSPHASQATIARRTSIERDALEIEARQITERKFQLPLPLPPTIVPDTYPHPSATPNENDHNAENR